MKGGVKKNLSGAKAPGRRFRQGKGDLGRKGKEEVEVVRLCKGNKNYNKNLGYPNERERKMVGLRQCRGALPGISMLHFQ